MKSVLNKIEKEKSKEIKFPVLAKYIKGDSLFVVFNLILFILAIVGYISHDAQMIGGVASLVLLTFFLFFNLFFNND